MPRSAKCRRVCQMPAHCRFAPEQPAHGEAVELTVEEYEAVRLVDYLGLNQEEAAAQMGVARTTVQRIYPVILYTFSAALRVRTPVIGIWQ